MRCCLGIINADTESTKEGRISSFCASPFISRLKFTQPAVSRNWGTERRNLEYLKLEMIRTFPLTEIRTTSQDEMREYFRNLEISAQNAEAQIREMNRRYKKVRCFYIVLFANQTWDLNVLRGVIFPPGTEFHAIGSESDLVELQAGHIHFRDFLRMTGFRSIHSAGLCCLSAKKQDGESVYDIQEIPKKWNDYSEEQKTYMENDILVMDESLKIILNRKENMTIRTMNDLPLTSTGFMRWRMTVNDDIINYDGFSHDVSNIINKSRWFVMRRNLAYLMRSYKGGYCGPNPRVQFMLLNNIRCYDAKSMYPHKMLFFQMLQCLKGVEVEDVRIREDNEIRTQILSVIEYAKSARAFDRDGIFIERLEDALPPFIATLDLRLDSRCRNGIRMMPFLSTHKTEGEQYNRNVYRSNGKIISADRVRVILSSVDLFLTCLCYNVTLLNCTQFLRMQWLPMMNVQKRPVVVDFRKKDLFSRIRKLNRFNEEVRAYWEDEAGFSYDAILRMTDDEYKEFSNEYYQLTKSGVNGQYGLTVQRPINAVIRVNQDENGLFEFVTEHSLHDKEVELLEDPEKAPKRVKVSDYCAGASITMWARWQLISLMYAFYQHDIEVYYCDTDSLFVRRSEEADRIVSLFNERLKTLYYETSISKEEKINVDDLGGIGEFEVDKDCKVWRTLGAKNYGYMKEDGTIKLTIAGLNVRNYIKAIYHAAEKEGLTRKQAFKKYYRPNICIAPDVANKLILDKSTCRYDENGDWIGPVLTPCGFDMISMGSTFHLHNANIAAELQNKKNTFWIGEFEDRIYLEKDGFTTIKPSDMKGRLYQQMSMILDDRQPIRGGHHYGKKRI